jgi:UDP-N-acetylglucosamine--N-acetylmuramyl-(pentapeptide) pyrophosphoryl-undecaprenol N-acetylglucosamine transferase
MFRSTLRKIIKKNMKKEKKIKIVFTTGGSGGHIFPLVAVIRELKLLLPKDSFIFYYIGPKNKLSEEYVKKEGVVMKNILAGKLRRYNDPIAIFQNIVDIFIKIPIGIIQSFFLLYFISPDLIFSKGGHGSLPVVLNTAVLRIPVFFHESDKISGKTNQLLQRFATEIFTSFPDTEGIAKEKMINVGNPIRAEIMGGDKKKAREIFKLKKGKPVVLILGGSQGSEKINDIFISIANDFLKDFQVIHQSGENNYKQMLAESNALINKDLRDDYHLYPFLKEEEVRNGYEVADLVVARAGAGNIFEISANGKASILLPLQNSAQNHQVKNAYSYAKTGATIVFEEGNFTPQFFLGKVRELFYPREQLEIMEENAKKFARPQAGYVVASYIKEYLI